MRIISLGRLSVSVMVPSPTLSLPDHLKMAPVPEGGPSNEFFAAGSSFRSDEDHFVGSAVGQRHGSFTDLVVTRPFEDGAGSGGRPLERVLCCRIEFQIG